MGNQTDLSESLLLVEASRVLPIKNNTKHAIIRPTARGHLPDRALEDGFLDFSVVISTNFYRPSAELLVAAQTAIRLLPICRLTAVT